MTGADTADARERIASLLEIRRWDEARRLLATQLAAAPDDSALLILLARANLGAGQNAEALTAADAACAAEPENAFAHYWRTMALLELGSRATESAQRCVELAPHLPTAWFALTRAELARHNTPRAFAAAEEVLRTAPGAPIGHHAMGLVHLDRREWSEAEHDYREALRLAPSSPVYLNNLGFAMLRQGKSKDAAEHFSTAGAIDPGDSDLYLKNAAAAGEAYIQRPHARLRREAGLAIGGAIFVFVIVFSKSGALFVLGLVTVLVVAAVVLDRIRMRHLPVATRLAVQSQRREKRNAWRHPRHWTARQWRLVVAICVLVGFSIAIGLTPSESTPDSNPPASPSGTDVTTCALARAGLLTDAHGRVVSAADLGCPAD